LTNDWKEGRGGPEVRKGPTSPADALRQIVVCARCHSSWNLGMSDGSETPHLLSLIRDLFGPLIYISLAAYPLPLVFGPTAPVSAGIGVAYGCLFIRLVVRWINRRDDPMSARLPADEP
jgi:hypothetical protein